MSLKCVGNSFCADGAVRHGKRRATTVGMQDECVCVLLTSSSSSAAGFACSSSEPLSLSLSLASLAALRLSPALEAGATAADLAAPFFEATFCGTESLSESEDDMMWMCVEGEGGGKWSVGAAAVGRAAQRNGRCANICATTTLVSEDINQ
jgi:hypothetical protein